MELTDNQIDQLLLALDREVDSWESGLECTDETRNIVRKWFYSLRPNDYLVFPSSGKGILLNEIASWYVSHDPDDGTPSISITLLSGNRIGLYSSDIELFLSHFGMRLQ